MPSSRMSNLKFKYPGLPVHRPPAHDNLVLLRSNTNQAIFLFSGPSSGVCLVSGEVGKRSHTVGSVSTTLVSWDTPGHWTRLAPGTYTLEIEQS